jgi:hypothetical protein
MFFFRTVSLLLDARPSTSTSKFEVLCDRQRTRQFGVYLGYMRLFSNWAFFSPSLSLMIWNFTNDWDFVTALVSSGEKNIVYNVGTMLEIGGS